MEVQVFGQRELDDVPAIVAGCSDQGVLDNPLPRRAWAAGAGPLGAAISVRR